MTERLWAGWRMAYLRGASESAGGAGDCLFCSLAGQDPSSRTLVLERYRHAFLVLNAFPYTTGHLMVAPYRHAEDLLSESMEARAEILAALERARVALAREYGPDGFNLGANLGRAAGAGVIGHLHWHLVPRWLGDTNFMPAVAGVRVIPEALPDTYARLLAALANTVPEGVTVEGRGGDA
jgi:ATP adenylyltransferase